GSILFVCQLECSDRTRGGTVGDMEFTHADMAAVVGEVIPRTIIGGLWAKRIINQSGANLAGTSAWQAYFGDYHRLAAVATDFAGTDTFAHELGHVLINEGAHTGSGLMESGSSRDKTQTGADRLTDEELTRIRANALGWTRNAATTGE
ncbi:MAG: hypothetical protein AAGC55_17590, partial [Myxococcota bacterium]